MLRVSVDSRPAIAPLEFSSLSNQPTSCKGVAWYQLAVLLMRRQAAYFFQMKTFHNGIARVVLRRYCQNEHFSEVMKSCSLAANHHAFQCFGR